MMEEERTVDPLEVVKDPEVVRGTFQLLEITKNLTFFQMCCAIMCFYVKGPILIFTLNTFKLMFHFIYSFVLFF